MSRTFLAPHLSVALPLSQERSRATLDRLLDATEAVLKKEGLGATTIAAVAERAGVSVGAVYKRFPDKDALLRGVYERFFTRSAQANAAALQPERWASHSASGLIDSLVAGMVHGYFEQRDLLRALILLAETHPESRFREHAESLRKETFERIATLLLARRAEIQHQNAAPAIEFSLMLLGLGLRGIVFDATRTYKFAQSERVLARELARVMKAYLGCDSTTIS
ncbi:MAG: TetR/AcrR family transcriptional regulator [Gemmatimonadaceae bacterium]